MRVMRAPLPVMPAVMIRANLMRGPPRLNGQIPFAHHIGGMAN